MGLYIGDRKVNDLHRGGEPIGAMYQGTRKIWTRPPQGMRWEQAYNFSDVAVANGIDFGKDLKTVKPDMVEGHYPSLVVRPYGSVGIEAGMGTIVGYAGVSMYNRIEWIGGALSMDVFKEVSGGTVIGKRESIPGSRDVHAQVDVWRLYVGKVPLYTMEDAEAILEVPGAAAFAFYTSGRGTLKAAATGETINVTFPALPNEDPGEGAASRHVRLHLIVHAGRAYAAIALPGQQAQVLGSVSVPTMPKELTMQLDTAMRFKIAIFTNTMGTSVASKRMSLSTGPFARADTAAAGIVLP